VQHSVDAPGSVSGLVAVDNPENGTSLLCWSFSTSEFTIQELEKRAGSVRFATWIFLADRFTKGHTVEGGRQYLRLHHGAWNEAAAHWQDWFDQVSLKTPARPDWTEGTAIYEVHVGRAPFLDGISYEPYPTMADLVDDVPRIAGMGFEVIQVMPHWPFCGYTVHDYYQIEKQYGEPDQLKALTALAHRLGLRVILDVVLHGCVDREIIRWDMSVLDPRYHFIFGEWLKAADERSWYREAHPEWFMQDEEGNTARIYTWAFDHLNPSYQEYLIGALKYYLDEIHVDGFRFDAPTWNCIPNWKPGLPYRPSAAYYGCHQLLQRIRQEVKASYPHALLYTEPSGPLFRNTMDLTYNYDEEWLSGSLVDVVSERGFAGARLYTGEKISARQAAEWLQYRRLSLPRGSQTVHHLDSHDTFWWGEKAQFRREAFGVAASQALFAMYAFLDGGIMNYAGAEQGSEDFYHKVLHLRQNTPALRYGACDYLAVQADPDQVLALLRSHEGAHFIPVINLSPEPVTARLTLPREEMGLRQDCETLVYDVFNHQPVFPEGSPNPRHRISPGDARIVVDLPAYGIRVLQILSTANIG
jgi:glycosidase